MTLAGVIGVDGSMRELHVLSASAPDLERAAVDAVRQWEFSPTLLNCEPIELRIHVTMNFAAGR